MLTRRPTRAFAPLVLLAALTLTACGSDDATSENNPQGWQLNNTNGADMHTGVDMTADMPAPRDMEIVVDMAPTPDMAPPVDMPPVLDMAPVPDMAPPPDMPPVVDMAPTPDMTPPVDMAPTPDMAPDMPPVVDMAPDMPPVVDMAPDMPPVVDMAPDMPPVLDMAPDMPPVVDMGPDPDMSAGMCDPTFGPTSACGGSLTGTWTLQDACFDESTLTGTLTQLCPAATLTYTKMATGSITFSAAGTFTRNVTGSADVQINVPTSCVFGQCSLAQQLAQNYLPGATCTQLPGAQACSCTGTINIGNQDTGTYSAVGGTVSLTTLSGTTTYNYCSQGGGLSMRDTNMQSAEGQFTQFYTLNTP